MSHAAAEELIRQLKARGVRVLEDEENTPEFILGVIRENRRRYAHHESMQAMGRMSDRLARSLAGDTGIAPRDISRVLLSLSSKIGALAIGHGLPADVLCSLMTYAADDLDRQENNS